jgi:hypothetical protein
MKGKLTLKRVAKYIPSLWGRVRAAMPGAARVRRPRRGRAQGCLPSPATQGLRASGGQRYLRQDVPWAPRRPGRHEASERAQDRAPGAARTGTLIRGTVRDGLRRRRCQGRGGAGHPGQVPGAASAPATQAGHPRRCPNRPGPGAVAWTGLLDTGTERVQGAGGTAWVLSVRGRPERFQDGLSAA